MEWDTAASNQSLTMTRLAVHITVRQHIDPPNSDQDPASETDPETQHGLAHCKQSGKRSPGTLDATV